MADIKATLECFSDKKRMARFPFEYFDVGEYEDSIMAACANLKSYIEHMTGSATEDPKYRVTFDYKGGGERGSKSEATDLTYSQMLAAQKAGLMLAERLRQDGELEVASGQRK